MFSFRNINLNRTAFIKYNNLKSSKKEPSICTIKDIKRTRPKVTIEEKVTSYRDKSYHRCNA